MAQLKVKQISDFVTAGWHNSQRYCWYCCWFCNRRCTMLDVAVNTSAIALNTAKVGITTDQSSSNRC